MSKYDKFSNFSQAKNENSSSLGTKYPRNKFWFSQKNIKILWSYTKNQRAEFPIWNNMPANLVLQCIWLCCSLLLLSVPVEVDGEYFNLISDPQVVEQAAVDSMRKENSITSSPGKWGMPAGGNIGFPIYTHLCHPNLDYLFRLRFCIRHYSDAIMFSHGSRWECAFYLSLCNFWSKQKHIDSSCIFLKCGHVVLLHEFCVQVIRISNCFSCIIVTILQKCF